jgi:hypothetical protein
MDFEQFRAAKAAAKQEYAARQERQPEVIADEELREVSEADRAAMLGPCLAELLVADVRAIQEGRDSAGYESLSAYRIHLRKRVGEYFTHKREAQSDGLNSLMDVLNEYSYTSEHVTGFRILLHPGEKVIGIDWRFVTTSEDRKIDRWEAQESSRPNFFTKWRWDERFVSEGRLRELEAEAEREKENAGRPPWADSRNYDHPNGIRP